MKYITVLFLIFSFSLNAQVDSLQTDSLKAWKSQTNIQINFSNVALKNWAGGGNAAMSLSTDLNYEIDYENNQIIWDNELNLQYGITRQGEQRSFRKTDDQISFQSLIGYQLDKNSNLSFLLEARTQFDQGFQFEETDSIPNKSLISSFLSPGYLIMNLGYTARKKDLYSLTISPLAGKITIVQNDSLSNAGAFGVDPGSQIRNELGASIVSSFRYEIFKNVNFRFSSDLFTNYSSKFSVDINSRAVINMKVNKFLNSSISATLIYDDDVLITKDDGTTGKAVQFRNTINIGVNLSF